MATTVAKPRPKKNGRPLATSLSVTLAPVETLGVDAFQKTQLQRTILELLAPAGALNPKGDELMEKVTEKMPSKLKERLTGDGVLLGAIQLALTNLEEAKSPLVAYENNRWKATDAGKKHAEKYGIK